MRKNIIISLALALCCTGISCAQVTNLTVSPKSVNNSNPLSDTQFMADPTAVEYNGRLYVYATNDQEEFDATQGRSNNSYGKINQLVCLSTNDFVNWTNHGIIDVKAAAPWIWTSWAPSIVSREEKDGKTHFYMYFTNSAAAIGVLTATSPEGPWTDPLGKALIDKQTPGLGDISQIIDPGVAINDDGTEAYLTFGGGDLMGTQLQPGNARIVKLGDDMISLASDIKPISAPCQFEANELNYIGGKWVYSYCTRWDITDQWSSYGSSQPVPAACSMAYMTCTDPLADQWTYRGTFLPNPGTLGYPYSNNHSHLQKYGSNYYLLYHTQWLENKLGYDGGYRNLQMSKITVSERSARITAITASSNTIHGVQMPNGMYVNPFERQSGKMSATATKDYWMVRTVNFDAAEAPAQSLEMQAKGKGEIEVYIDSYETTTPIATVQFSGSANTLQTVSVPLKRSYTGTASQLYFVRKNNVNLDVESWQFSTSEAGTSGITSIATNQGAEAATKIYSISGIQQATIQKGINIVKRNGKSIKIVK